VAKKLAKGPIFEGNMPPKKMYPQKWRQYWRHNRNPVIILSPPIADMPMMIAFTIEHITYGAKIEMKRESTRRGK
jgi:hypothetical protein